MINKYKQVKQTALFFFISYISILVFSFFLYATQFSQLLSYEVILKSVLTSVILWYLLYFFSFYRYFYYLIIFLLALIITIKIYYTFILGIHIEPSIFEGMFDTNLDEAKRLGSSKPLFIFLAILSFFTIVIEFNWFKTFAFKERVKVHLLKIIVISGLLIGYGLYKHDLHTQSLIKLIKQTFPISFINYFYEAAHSRYKLYKMNKNKIDIVQKYNFIRNEDDNLTVVFVRAESLRSRSFPISDESIPLSYRIDDIKNAVYYNNIFSYANYTQAAVPWMLTRSINDELLNEKSLISAVRHVGFDTTWIGCDHSNLASFATSIVNYSLEANQSLFLGKLNEFIKSNPKSNIVNNIVGSQGNGYDGKQIAYTITQIQNSKIEKKFFWIEMNGSHVPWTPLTPDTFKIYKPFCKKSLDEIKECSEEEATNSYKNTILYTQYLIKKLILSLKNKNAIVFFASDHGESTGENGYYGHGFMLPKGKRKIRDQINPAFMVWMSDTFKKKHKHEYNVLKKNANSYMKHDIIFHSLLYILGIESPIINKRKSIFSNIFIGRQKPIKITLSQNNIVIDKFDNNELIFHMKDNNPAPNYTSTLNLHFTKNKSIELYISDLYSNQKFPDRVKYFVYKNNTILYQGDIGDNKGTNNTLVKINFKEQEDRKVLIKIVAQKGIESTWDWGAIAKIKIKFKEITK